MPIADYQQAAQTIADFLNSLNKLGGMRLKFRITAGEGARDPDGIESREIYVELSGPDAPLTTDHNGELLRALETVATQMLKLDQPGLVSFDAEGFKAQRVADIRLSAHTAAEQVRATGLPFSFAPMNSRERRILHLVFKEIDDLETASKGEGPDRHLAVYVKGQAPAEEPRTYGLRDRRSGDSRSGNRGPRGFNRR